jgi:hypothetical protein
MEGAVDSCKVYCPGSENNLIGRKRWAKPPFSRIILVVRAYGGCA